MGLNPGGLKPGQILHLNKSEPILGWAYIWEGLHSRFYGMFDLKLYFEIYSLKEAYLATSKTFKMELLKILIYFIP